MEDQNIDIIIILIGHIVTEKLISIPNIGIINKHASLLPSNRGLFPYFWSFLKNEEQGVSFHKVKKDIDQGPILFKKKISKKYCPTMISFYRYVFDNYPNELIKSIENLIHKNYFYKYKKGSYNTLPSNNDFKKFKNKGGVIINLRDIIDG